MSNITLVGLDPSMSNFGMVKGNYDLSTGEFELTHLKLAETKPDSKNKSVRKNSQDLKRATELCIAMHEFTKGATLICVEIPVGSQSARAMASYGMCIGILASLDIPLIQVTPAEVKLAATDKKTATKQEMIDWAVESFPEANWLTRTVKGVKTYVAKNEHLADALAAIAAGLETEQFKQVSAILNKT